MSVRHGSYVPASLPLLRLAASVLAVFLIALALVPAAAFADIATLPELKEAKSAVLMDQGGNVLLAVNPDMELPPASITKVMTAMVALDSGLDLNAEVELVAPDLGDNSQMADYGTGDRVSLGGLLRIMLVYSANDAAYNTAVFVAGSEEAFVQRMNEKAAAIGMKHTHFENSHGLESDHHLSTAMDLAILGKYALENYPLIAQTAVQLEGTTTVHGETIVLTATNKMLWSFPGMRGIKTGAVTDNYTFMGASGRGKIQLYSAVLGCTTFTGRFDDTASMMEWGYANYGDLQLAHPEWTVRYAPCAFDFSRKVAISPREFVAGKTWPTEGEVSATSDLNSGYELVEPGSVCGYTDWTQANRYMASELYTAKATPETVSTWPALSQPLFDAPTSANL